MSNHKWTIDELDIVRREYDGHNRGTQRIADKLGVTFFAVKGQAAKMGIQQDKSPDWTDRELERLAELIHIHTTTQIAKILHRSTNAVKVKATRLKLGLRTRDGWFTKKEVSEICGVDHKKVQAWIDKGFLIATWHNGRKPQQDGMNMWHIKIEDVRDFLTKHSGELLGRNTDIQQIVWILTEQA